jgi:hypothetical protein
MLLNAVDDLNRDSVGNVFAVRECDVIARVIELPNRLLGPFNHLFDDLPDDRRRIILYYMTVPAPPRPTRNLGVSERRFVSGHAFQAGRGEVKDLRLQALRTAMKAEESAVPAG